MTLFFGSTLELLKCSLMKILLTNGVNFVLQKPCFRKIWYYSSVIIWIINVFIFSQVIWWIIDQIVIRIHPCFRKNQRSNQIPGMTFTSANYNKYIFQIQPKLHVMWSWIIQFHPYHSGWIIVERKYSIWIKNIHIRLPHSSRYFLHNHIYWKIQLHYWKGTSHSLEA